MKKFIFTLVIFLTGFFAVIGVMSAVNKIQANTKAVEYVDSSPAPTPVFRDLLNAIEYVESKGIATAVGDNGKAVGAYQLHEIYVKDYYRISGSGPYGDNVRLDRWFSRMITETVTQHYAHAAYPELDINDLKFMEAAARVHNGGGDGWRDDPEWFVRNRGYTLEDAKKKIAKTQAYWKKVKARMYYE